jgi:1-aminocyclopropane-1-carboxylate deaminase/D-cysteine desulfhydrase-like pyridoxal-dependent ACC family enzyme
MIEAIEKLPRVKIGCYPTPLMEAEHLSKVLGGPRILVKRDDLTGLALGGNKLRKLEFLLAEGHDSYIISGVSNLAMALASACAKLDIKLRQILPGDVSPQQKLGNYYLHKILGTDMKILETGGSPQTVEEGIARRNALLDREAPKLREEGYSPHVMRSFESPPIENIGWTDAADEICEQLKARDIKAQYLIITNCQGGTQAGLEVGAKYLGYPFKVIGISNIFSREKATEDVARMANETAEFLNLDISFSPDEITVYDEYIGEGYGKLSQECVEAIKLVARTEGFFLDPVYTGKAMAGLIDLIHKGCFTSRDTVVFVHSGGIPDLFVYEIGV